MTNPKKKSFKQWLSELQELFTEHGKDDPDRKGAKKFWNNYVEMTDADCWKHFYDDGETPQDAFDAEIDAYDG